MQNFLSMITMLQAIYLSLSLAQTRKNLQSVTDDNWVEHSRVNWRCRRLHLHEIKKNNGVEKKNTHCSSCKENLIFIIFTMKNIFYCVDLHIHHSQYVVYIPNWKPLSLRRQKIWIISKHVYLAYILLTVYK